jgi:hypothetical protein
VIVPFVAGSIWDLSVAANVAQLASVPLAAVGLLGVSLIPKKDSPRIPQSVSPTVGEPTEQKSSGDGEGSAPQRESGRAATERRRSWTTVVGAAPRFTGILLGTGLAVAAVLIWVDSAIGNDPPSTYGGRVDQPITITAGPKPVLFDGGTSWRWLDLPSGLTTVTLSPGGGAKNDELLEIGGTIASTGSCVQVYDKLAYTFKADGQPLGPRFSGSSTIELPDHVDVLTLNIDVVQHEGCTIGLVWDNPAVVRNGPVPS